MAREEGLERPDRKVTRAMIRVFYKAKPGEPQRSLKFFVWYKEGWQVRPVQQGAGEKPRMWNDGVIVGTRL